MTPETPETPESAYKDDMAKGRRVATRLIKETCGLTPHLDISNWQSWKERIATVLASEYPTGWTNGKRVPMISVEGK